MLQIFRTLFYQKTSKFNTLASIEHKKSVPDTLEALSTWQKLSIKSGFSNSILPKFRNISL